MSEEGTLPAALRDAMGLQPGEEARLQAAMQKAYREYQALVQSHSRLIPTPPDLFRIPPGQETQTFETTGFRAEGAALKEQLRATMEMILGVERAGMLWQQVQSSLNDFTLGFGLWETTRTVRIVRQTDEGAGAASDRWTEYRKLQYVDGKGVRQGMKYDRLEGVLAAHGEVKPDVRLSQPSPIFQPFVAAWQQRHPFPDQP